MRPVSLAPTAFVQLEKDTAAIARVDEDLVVSAFAASAEWLVAELPQRLGRFLDALHLEGDVVKTGPVVAQESGQEALVCGGLQQLSLDAAAGDGQGNAVVTGAGILETSGILGGWRG